MMPKSAQWPTNADSTTATSIIHGIGPQKYDRNFSRGLTGFSGSSLYP